MDKLRFSLPAVQQPSALGRSFFTLFRRHFLKKVKRPSSIRLWFVFLFTCCILLPFVLLATTMSFYFDNMYNEHDRQLSSNTLYALAKSVRVYFNDLDDISLTPYYYSDLMGYMKGFNSSRFYHDDYYQSQLVYNYDQCWSNILNVSRKDIANVIYIPISDSGDDGILLQQNSGHLQILQGYHFNSQDWVKEAIAKNGRLFYSAITQEKNAFPNSASFITDNSAIFSVSRLIMDINTHHKVGVIRIDASDSTIKDIFDNIHASQNSVYLLLNQNKKVVYTTRKVTNEMVSKIGRGESNFRSGNDTYVVTTRIIPDTSWELVYLSSQNDVRDNNRPIFTIAALIATVVFLVASVVFLFQSGHILGRVSMILNSIRKIEGGDLNVRVQLKGRDEFTVIASALSRMAEKLNTHIDSEYRAVLSQRNAEYLALQMQINPHFLYNTLNGFITLNRLGKVKLLEQSIISLTRLFRYSCSKEPTGQIKDELKFVEEYLALQKLRFDTRLKYHIELEPEAADIRIPRLLIQPIVENSIVHGMEPNEDPILIEIYAFFGLDGHGGRLLFLRVSDNGPGFDTSSLPPTGRVGLGNIRERVNLLGDGSMFTVTSRNGAGTICTFTFPVCGRSPDKKEEQR